MVQPTYVCVHNQYIALVITMNDQSAIMYRREAHVDCDTGYRFSNSNSRMDRNQA